MAAATGADARIVKKKERAQRGPAAMSHISGVKRPLTHTNSFTGERVPLYGVETPHEEQLGKVKRFFSFFQLLHSSKDPKSAIGLKSCSKTFGSIEIYYKRNICLWWVAEKNCFS